ncbi:MAG: hypothetical protein M3Q91_10665 [Acidobacteriota bacterium]|nr:hypothetical protein [Acidobacteriota bacterium]
MFPGNVRTSMCRQEWKRLTPTPGLHRNIRTKRDEQRQRAFIAASVKKYLTASLIAEQDVDVCF